MIPLLASQFLLPLPDRYSSPQLSAEQKRQQTLNVLVDWLLKEAEREPLMAVWEDIHWADPSTIELLGLLIERAGKSEAPLFTLMTFRSDDARLTSTADIEATQTDVCFVPIADMRRT